MSDLIFDKEAREKLANGINKLANAIKVTLGPKGKYTIYSDYGRPFFTKDGATVASAFKLTDPYENIGAELVKQVALETNEDTGDGTTTATILAQYLINSAIREINAGANSVDIKKGIEIAAREAVKSITSLSTEVNNDYKAIRNVATISSNNDNFLGKLIADTLKEVNYKGYVSIEESQSGETYHDIIKGLQLNEGYTSSYFINHDSKQVIMENAAVVLLNFEVNNIKEIQTVLEHFSKIKKQFYIICNNMDSSVTNNIIYNIEQGRLETCVIITPGFGDTKKNNLLDIGALCNAKVFDNSDELRTVSNDVAFGKVNKIISNKNITTIYNENDVEEYVKSLKEDINYESFKHQIDERIAKLQGGVAVIYAGGKSKLEAKERKVRIQDALSATMSAIDEGIVPGGGTTYIKVHRELTSDMDKDSNKNIEVGQNILLNALLEPFRNIVLNCGKSYDLLMNQIYYTEFEIGYNALTDECGDMFDFGVIDPTKVSIAAIENAVSIATMIITTECVLNESVHQYKSF